MSIWIKNVCTHMYVISYHSDYFANKFLVKGARLNQKVKPAKRI